MWLIYLVLLVIVGSIVSVIVALIYMAKKRKYIASLPEITIRAEVIGSTSKYDGHKYPLYKPYKLGTGPQSIIFLTDKNQYIKLNVSKKEYNRLLPTFYGDLTYKANGMISFKRLKGHEEARLQAKEEERLSRIDPNQTILFYCDAVSLGVTVPTSQPEPYTVKTVLDYIDLVYTQECDQFFGLDNGTYVIQFSSTTEDDIILDIPDVTKGGSYQATISNKEEVKHLVQAYYDGVAIMKLVDTEFMRY